MNKIKISYNEFGNMLNELVKQIQSSEQLSTAKYIYAPARGGLPVAVHLSHHLDIPMETSLGKLIEKVNVFEPILIVDDIADTGRTLEHLATTLNVYHNKYFTATLFYKPHSSYKPNIFITQVKNDDWIVFPYERMEEEAIQDYLR